MKDSQDLLSRFGLLAFIYWIISISIIIVERLQGYKVAREIKRSPLAIIYLVSFPANIIPD